jgi:2-polyprenyl-3-methyl-5-hydroxy-6-metoxy-1,4-benzoquinol methylase
MRASAGNPSPDLFFEASAAYQRTEALRAALELDLFTAIGEGRGSAAALAAHCSASEKGIRVLCDYLAFVGFLSKESGCYALTPDSAAFLDRRSPAYMGGTLEFLHTDTLRKGYANLAAAVRKGGTVQSPGGLTDPEHPDWVRFAKVMAPMMALPAQLAAQLIDRPLDARLEVLDIAAGHGLYGIEVAKRFPGAQIHGLDWPRVLEVAQENARLAGIAQRYYTIAGSAFEVPLGGEYDVVLIPNFLHHFGVETCTAFLRRVHKALKPGGLALTVEFVPNEDRLSPPFPATFALAMLVATADGDAFTFAELDRMFRNAGFSRNTLHALEPSAQQAILSHK